MKMNPHTFAALSDACTGMLGQRPDAARTYREAGLSPKRFRWDLLSATDFPVGTLYREGLNDDHIDTALRRITGTKAEW